MKGFLSFFGITLIAAAFGLILLSFHGNPLEELKIQKRQLAYQEMRANHSTHAVNYTFFTSSINNDFNGFYSENEQRCNRFSLIDKEQR